MHLYYATFLVEARGVEPLSESNSIWILRAQPVFYHSATAPLPYQGHHE